MSRKKKTIAFDKVTPETRRKLAEWLDDRIADLEIDAKFVRIEEGADFLPALRGLAEHLRGEQ